jgi:hypothetical protein
MTGTVVAFRGCNLVAVRVEPDRFAIMLAKIGEPVAQFQTAYPTLAEAEREAREGAALCGWRYVGVFDPHRLSEIEKWSGDGLARRQAEADGTGPDAA